MELIEYGDYRYETVDFPIDHYILLGKRFKQFKKDENGQGIYVLGPRNWKFNIWGLLFDPWNGFFSKHGWDPHLYPSWGSGFNALVNNIMIRLTPWYRNRRILIENLYNRNESKLLSSDRKSCSMRNRDADTRYFYVSTGFIFGRMEVTRYVDSSGQGANMFLTGIVAGLSGDLSKAKELKEERTVLIRRMPILTRKQCERFLDAAVSATKGMLSWD